ncbi:hypothetical protein [uncultured Methanomethylovorans sp.]|uniref:hypothetical protein n=1 Tax=uncultured Methanomethylovorans sp. TaxID=183759 RepID=UPI002AA6BB79|nr:hypothetical protein [uncultured Methanomethylovorans sp.]
MDITIRRFVEIVIGAIIVCQGSWSTLLNRGRIWEKFVQDVGMCQMVRGCFAYLEGGIV